MISSVGRLRAHLRSPQPVERACYADWLGRLADIDGAAPGSTLIDADEWILIRHLPLALDWQLDASAADIGARWQSALHAAIDHALSHADDGAVLRYRTRQAALADLLYRSALGDDSRQWAWQQMGLLPHSPLPPADALLHGARGLLSEPVLIWPVLHRLIAAEARSAALSAVLRALPHGQWTILLLSCPQTADFTRAAMANPPDTLTPPGDVPPTGDASTLNPALPDAIALLDWARRRPALVAAHRDTLTVLLATLTCPAAAHATRMAPQLIRAARLALPGQQAPHTARTPAASPAGTPPPLPNQATEPLPTQQTPAGDLVPPPPELPDTGCDLPTAQAGLLFWLGQINTGQPELEALPPLDEALPLWLRALGRALGCEDDDAALRAFCGGSLPHGADTPADIDALAQATMTRWGAWVDALAPDLPAPRLQHICRRPGTIRIEPGWIELRLSLDQVETPIRRLGLDLDPGWLPWLGCVLKVRYEG